MPEEERTDDELELETLEVETRLVEAEGIMAEPIVELTPEQVASRQRAHDITVAKFQSGGKF